jgi:hypothetical protein
VSRFPTDSEEQVDEVDQLRRRVESRGDVMVNRHRYEALKDCARLLLEAMDLMGNSPDEYDEGMARTYLEEAVVKAKEGRGP